MSDDNEAKLQVLANHYNETFALLKNDVGKRDRLFLYILIVIFLLLLYMSAPDAVSDLLNSFMNTQAGTETANRLIDTSFVGLILWIGLLSLTHSYFQIVLHIERQYDYVYQLEQQLSQYFGGAAFVREGKHYRANKRKFAKWTKFLFWFLFPLLFVFFNVAWLSFLFTASETPFIYIIVDIVLSVSILVSLGFYLWALIKKK